jgi:hypothetical protein
MADGFDLVVYGLVRALGNPQPSSNHNPVEVRPRHSDDCHFLAGLKQIPPVARLLPIVDSPAGFPPHPATPTWARQAVNFYNDFFQNQIPFFQEAI